MDLLLSNFQQIGNALGWALIHFIWQGFILVASYFAITRLFLKNKIHLHYWTGIFFIVLSLIIPIKEFILQLQLNTDLNSSALHQLSANITIIASTGILNPVDMIISLIQKLIPYLVSIWTVVILLISSNLTKSWFELVKLSKNNAIDIPQNLLNTIERNSKILKLKFKPIISISSQVIIPATFGFFKPVILLPASLISQLPQDQMEAILLHELCHIKRSDFIHNILQLLVETLFFYHPFTKWMSADIRKIREQCCDELVLKLETKPILYAKALTNLASLFNQQNKGKTSHLQIAATDGELLNRIKILMLQKKTKSPLIHLISGVLLSLVVLTFFNNMTKNNTSFPVTNTNLLSAVLNKNTSTEFENKPSYLVPNLINLINDEESQREITKRQLTQKNDNIEEKKSSRHKLELANPVIDNKVELDSSIIQVNSELNDPQRSSQEQVNTQTCFRTS
jgi:beta-lactamase regulating signal transducer with metallopeptidase domain